MNLDFLYRNLSTIMSTGSLTVNLKSSKNASYKEKHYEETFKAAIIKWYEKN